MLVELLLFRGSSESVRCHAHIVNYSWHSFFPIYDKSNFPYHCPLLNQRWQVVVAGSI